MRIDGDAMTVGISPVFEKTSTTNPICLELSDSDDVLKNHIKFKHWLINRTKIGNAIRASIVPKGPEIEACF